MADGDCDLIEVCDNHKCAVLECADNQKSESHECISLSCGLFEYSKKHACISMFSVEGISDNPLPLVAIIALIGFVLFIFYHKRIIKKSIGAPTEKVERDNKGHRVRHKKGSPAPDSKIIAIAEETAKKAQEDAKNADSGSTASPVSTSASETQSAPTPSESNSASGATGVSTDTLLNRLKNKD
jgi:hypothetical protein